MPVIESGKIQITSNFNELAFNFGNRIIFADVEEKRKRSDGIIKIIDFRCFDYVPFMANNRIIFWRKYLLIVVVLQLHCIEMRMLNTYIEQQYRIIVLSNLNKKCAKWNCVREREKDWTRTNEATKANVIVYSFTK